MLDEHNDTFSISDLYSDAKYLDNHLLRMTASASRVLVSSGGSSGCGPRRSRWCAPYECECGVLGAMKPIITLDLGKPCYRDHLPAPVR